MSYTLENFYKSTITKIWSAGTGDFNVATAPTQTSGLLVISPNNSTLREIVEYSAVGTNSYGAYVTVITRGMGGTTAQTHAISEPIRMNITAEHWASMQDDIDNIVAAGASNASTTTKGIVEEATEAEMQSGSSTGGTGAKLFVTPALLETVSKNITVSLSSANLLAMYATPITVIAAPGAGKVILIENALLSFTHVSTAYASGGTIRLQYTGSADNLLTTGFQTNVLNTASNNLDYCVATRNVSYASPIGIAANTAVQITNATGAYTTGNGTAKLFINYRIVTL